MGRPPLRLGRPKGRPQAPFQPSHENRYPFTNWSTFAPPKWSKFTPPLTAPELFTTLFFGVYDVAESEFTYANAGHLPPFLIRDGERTLLDVTGVVIGAFPNMEYESRKVRLAVGDLLVAFTDGATEPENSYGQEFGEDRLWESLRRDVERPVEEIIAAAMDEVVAWTDGPTEAAR